jgi:predicted O-methyltransferase YrrM
MMRKTSEDDISRHPEFDDLEGFLWRREGARLAWLAQRVPAGQSIVEVGSNRGKSACYLAAGSKQGAKVKVHCHDLWTDGGQGEYQHLGFDLPETLDKFREQISAARVKSMIVEHQGDSVDAGLAWAGGPIGLLFLDGDHRYEAVKADLAAWAPHVAPGGWIAFHDYTRGLRQCTQFPGVVQLVDELVHAAPRGTDITRTGRLVAFRA